MPYSESASPAKRPSIAERQSSTHSITKASPSNKAKQHRTHAVGHGRLATRNLSHGKNLNKLSKLTSDDATATKSQKTKAQTPSTSPAAPSHGHMKRNSSNVSLPRVASKTSIKKNHSNVSLKRNGSSTHVNKSGRLSTSSKRPHSSHSELDHIDDKPTGGFIMDEGEDYEAQDDEWTEESASQSPSTTRRSSTSRGARSGKATPAEDYSKDNGKAHISDSTPDSPESSSSRDATTKRDSGFTMVNSQISHHPSRPPDAAAIASRLLGRNASQVLPKVHYISAMGTPGSQTPPLQHSQSFNLSDSFTPEDGVSRFLNAPASSGGSNYHLHDILSHVAASPPSPKPRSQSRERSPSPNGGDDHVRRVKSTGNFYPRAPTVTEDKPVGNAPPSFTFEQQDRSRKAYTLTKMNFWKAHMDKPEQGSVIPVVVKGVPLGMLGTEERNVRQWEDARVEISYLRRFRTPLVEAVQRVYKPTKLEIQHAREHEFSRALARDGLKDRHAGLTTSQNAKGEAVQHAETGSAVNGGTRHNTKAASKSKDRVSAKNDQSIEADHSEAMRAGSAGKPKHEHDDGNNRPPSRTGRSRSVRFEGGLEAGDEENAEQSAPTRLPKKKSDKNLQSLLRSLWAGGEMELAGGDKKVRIVEAK